MYSVLLVEDERIELEVLRDYVPWQKLGIGKIYTAKNGKIALDYLMEYEPDIMITDIKMPVMDGIELAERARAQGSNCRIIFLTGFDEFTYAKKAFQVQAEDYVLKPICFEELEELLVRVCRDLDDSKRQEEVLKASEGYFFEQVCCGLKPVSKELSGYVFQSSESKNSFEIMGYYGELAENTKRKIMDFPEVKHIFDLDRVYIIVANNYINTKNVAERIMRCVGNIGVIAYFSEKFRIDELEKATQKLISIKNKMYYAPMGEVISTRLEEVFYEKALDKSVFYLFRDELKTAIEAGSIEEVSVKYEDCLQEIMYCSIDECKREMYGLYMYIRNYFENKDREFPDVSEKWEKMEDVILGRSSFIFAKEYLNSYVLAVTNFQKELLNKQEHYTITYIKKYIVQNYGKLFDINEIAEQLNLSPNYLRSIFKEGTGSTIHEYLIDYRMEKACEMLKNKSYRIKDIAMDCGYENVSYFIQSFQKKYGVSPNEYRKMVY